jgi:hypothetical protein
MLLVSGSAQADAPKVAEVKPKSVTAIVKRVLKKNDLCRRPILAYRGPFGPAPDALLVVLSGDPRACTAHQFVVIAKKKRHDLEYQPDYQTNPVEGGNITCKKLVLEDTDGDGTLDPIAICSGLGDDGKEHFQNLAFRWWANYFDETMAEKGAFLRHCRVENRVRTLSTAAAVQAALKQLPASATSRPASQPTEGLDGVNDEGKCGK